MTTTKPRYSLGGCKMMEDFTACLVRYRFAIAKFVSKLKKALQKTYIFELQFFPTIYFFSILKQNQVVIEKKENYQKRSFRNKCIIASASGPLTLSVPLKKGKHERQIITDVLIAYDEPWKNMHLSSIKTAYHSSPFFDYYFPHIEQLYNNSGKYLFEFNWSILSCFAKILDLPKVECTTSYQKELLSGDMRGILTPNNYQQIILPKYNQVFEDRCGYLTNLSIIDLLFCCGPEAHQYLKSSSPT